MKFTINMLPARYGDCLLIEYGEEPNFHRILIDGGTGGTRREIIAMIGELPPEKRVIDLVVISHIDRDHIEGIMLLLEQKDLGFKVNDFWFNGWSHLCEDTKIESLGSKMGERVSQGILTHQLPWNKAFDGHAVVVPNDGNLPEVFLPCGMKLILLSPTVENLNKLRSVWERELKKAGLEPGYGELSLPAQPIDFGIESLGADSAPDVDALNAEKFEADEGEANGSSIAFIAEFADKKVLFLGDAFPETIYSNLRKMQPYGKIQIEMVKLSHHASKGNTSPELIELLDCGNYAISTNGSNYGHPHPQTIARVIKNGGANPHLIFNYSTPFNKIWDSDALRIAHSYRTSYPKDEGILVDIFKLST